MLEQGLVERLGPGFSDHRDPHLFSIEAKLKAEEHRAAVTQAMLAAVAEVAAGKVDARRLQAIKDNLRYGLLMGLETQEQIAVSLAWATGIAGSPDALDAEYRQMAAVTARDLTAFARKYLTSANSTTLVFTVEPQAAKGGAQ